MNTDKKIDYENIDYEAVSAWAESDMELLPVNPETIKSGAEAAKFGREVLARTGVDLTGPREARQNDPTDQGRHQHGEIHGLPAPAHSLDRIPHGIESASQPTVKG